MNNGLLMMFIWLCWCFSVFEFKYGLCKLVYVDTSGSGCDNFVDGCKILKGLMLSFGWFVGMWLFDRSECVVDFGIELKFSYIIMGIFVDVVIFFKFLSNVWICYNLMLLCLVLVWMCVFVMYSNCCFFCNSCWFTFNVSRTTMRAMLFFINRFSVFFFCVVLLRDLIRFSVVLLNFILYFLINVNLFFLKKMV